MLAHALVHFHIHHHGPPIDYAGIAAAAFLGWVGIPGAGEALLITGAVLASKHRLDLSGVLFAAFAGALVGGIVGWFIGLRAGRALVTARGPLLAWRCRALRSGERFFDRWGTIAVFFTPSWVVGITAMRPRRYLPLNAISAFLWAFGYGIAAYLLGPPVTRLIDGVGLVGSLVIGTLIAIAVGSALWRRRRQRRAEEA